MSQDSEKIKARKKLYYIENKEKISAYQKIWAQENKKKWAEYMRIYNSKNREELNRKAKEKRDGDKSYLERNKKNRTARLELIAGCIKSTVCDICGDGNNNIVFDHDHSSGQFRGWICHPCNASLGYVRDNIATLERMIQYLQKAKMNINPSFLTYNVAKAIGYRGSTLQGTKK